MVGSPLVSCRARRRRLKALRAQINPHFLFNALNAIAGWIPRDPARAEHTVERLAEVFRYTLRGSETEWVRLSEEIEFARAYLDVEKARFGERLAVEVNVGEGTGEARVPAMIVQTLVENAVKHGVARRRAGGRVSILSNRDGSKLHIEVRDDGPGFPPAAVGPGFGLRSVRERLAGYYGARAALGWTRDVERQETVVFVELTLLAPVEAERAQ